jgi:hypothetical protein
VNPLEVQIKQQLEADGWTVLRHGWPDFFCVKGLLRKAVEVKSAGDSIRPAQAKMHDALRLAGIDTEILPHSVPVEKDPEDGTMMWSIRLPTDLVGRVKEHARSERRSAASMIRFILEKKVEEALNGRSAQSLR